MNGLAGAAQVLETGANEVKIDPALGLRARLPIDRMLAFTAALTYVQTKYGRDRVAQIITFGRLKARAVLKDTGRVLPRDGRLARAGSATGAGPWRGGGEGHAQFTQG